MEGLAQGRRGEKEKESTVNWAAIKEMRRERWTGERDGVKKLCSFTPNLFLVDHVGPRACQCTAQGKLYNVCIVE